MTIKDRDVIKQLDTYLNPDPVDLIDGYLEKNVQVEPILPNLTEGGGSYVPDAFFKEFHIITKGDMRSTLFDTDFLDNEMALLKANGIVGAVGKLAGMLGRGRRIMTGGEGGVRDKSIDRDTAMQRISNVANKVTGKARGAKEATEKGWGTVKDNSWFAPWSAAWRGKVSATAKEAKQVFQEQYRLESEANKPIKSKMYKNSPRAYAKERGKLATQFANAHADAEKSMKDPKTGKLRKDYADNAMEALSNKLGVDPASGKERHSLKEVDTRTETLSAKKGEAAQKKGQKIQHVWGKSKSFDRKVGKERGLGRDQITALQKEGAVEVAVNEDTFGEYIDTKAGARRNELLEKHEQSGTGHGEALSEEERDELAKINDGMNIREQAEAAGTTLEMVEYHVNQIKRAGNPGLLDSDKRLKEVIPPDTSEQDWPDSFGGSNTANKVEASFNEIVIPKFEKNEEARGEGGTMNFEDAKLSSHVDHMRGREISSPGAKTEAQLASDVRTGTGVSGMGAGGVGEKDREYLKAGQSAPKWGGNQVQEITSPDGARYYSKKQSAQLREQHKTRQEKHKKQTVAEGKGAIARADKSKKQKQDKQDKRKATRDKITSDVKGKIADVIDTLSSQSKPTSVASKKVQQQEQEEEQAEKDAPKIAKKAQKKADKEQRDREKEAKKVADQAEKDAAEAERKKGLEGTLSDEDLISGIEDIIDKPISDREGGKLYNWLNNLLGGEGARPVEKALDEFFSLRKSKDATDVGVELTFFLDTFVLGVEYGLEVEEASEFALDMVSKSNSELNDYLDRTNISGDLFIKANLDSYKKDPVDEVQGMIDAIILLDAVDKVESK
ncbi:MAG: hypothetical protein CMB80_01590 [Flammeovirgaceae bacterium]|nr:hypothetical protein [Flammeovirgaceae bacterium]